MCLHEPVNKDDCRPNKALRTTIKVFLKKKGVEREGARKKEILAHAAAVPATSITPTVEATSARQQSQPFATPASHSQMSADVKQESQGTSQPMKAVSSSDKAPVQSGKDIPQQSIEVSNDVPWRHTITILINSLQSPGPQDTPRRASTQTAGDGSFVLDATDEKEQTKQQEQAKADDTQWSQSNSSGMNSNDFGFDVNGGFPNMANMGMGDFNPMMQFMPNGMPNNMMGQFPNMIGKQLLQRNSKKCCLLMDILNRRAWHGNGSDGHVPRDVWWLWRTRNGHEWHEHGYGLRYWAKLVWWL